jgi:hypothetical protein
MNPIRASSLRTALAWMVWVVGLVLVIRGVLVTTAGTWAVAQLCLGGFAFGIVGRLHCRLVAEPVTISGRLNGRMRPWRS